MMLLKVALFNNGIQVNASATTFSHIVLFAQKQYD